MEALLLPHTRAPLHFPGRSSLSLLLCSCSPVLVSMLVGVESPGSRRGELWQGNGSGIRRARLDKLLHAFCERVQGNTTVAEAWGTAFESLGIQPRTSEPWPTEEQQEIAAGVLAELRVTVRAAVNDNWDDPRYRSLRRWSGEWSKPIYVADVARPAEQP